MTARFIGTIAGAIALALAGAAQAQTKLTVGVQPTPDVIPAFVAKEEGFFAKHGLDVDLKIGVGSIQIGGVVAGSLQIGNPTIPQVLQAVDNGIDLQIICGGNFMSADAKQFGVVVRDGSGINKPQDYVGKKVGVNTIGAFLHVLFVEWLKKNGVDPKKVTYVEVAFPQMGDVMKQGQVDAIVAVDPFVSRIVNAKIGKADFDFVKEFPEGMPVVVYEAKRDWVAAHKKEVDGFRAAIGEAIAFMKANKKKADEDALKYLKIPAPVLAHLRQPDLRVDINVDRMKEWMKIMKGQGLVKGDIDMDKLVLK